MAPFQDAVAIVKEGYRVASGTSAKDPRFNVMGGTIRMQIPEFRKRGLDFDAYFCGKADQAYICGTLGLDLSPRIVARRKPEYHFSGIRWTEVFDKEGQPPFTEDFYLSPAEVVFAGTAYKALLYIPDPKTKPAHLHPPSTLELIAEKIPKIRYGDAVTLRYNPEAILISEPARKRIIP